MREAGNMSFGIFPAAVGVSLVLCSENCCCSRVKVSQASSSKKRCTEDGLCGQCKT